MTIWDLVEKEERAKERGIGRAQAANYRDVQIAREMAKEAWAWGYTEVSMDDVRLKLAQYHPDIKVGNWAGSVFKTSEWEPAGWVQSTHAGGHRRAIRTWKLKEVAR